MKVLFDENIPAPLRHHLTGHSVDTVQDRGWEGIRNGLLLDRVEDNGYELLITADQGIRHQQTLSGRQLAVLVLLSNSWPAIRHVTKDILSTVNRMTAGDLIELPVRQSGVITEF